MASGARDMEVTPSGGSGMAGTRHPTQQQQVAMQHLHHMQQMQHALHQARVMQQAAASRGLSNGMVMPSLPLHPSLPVMAMSGSGGNDVGQQQGQPRTESEHSRPNSARERSPSRDGAGSGSGAGSRKGSVGDTPGEIKLAHRATEKKRRKLIKDTINQLRELVPAQPDDPNDKPRIKTKAEILLETVDYVRELQANVALLQSQVRMAEDNAARLFSTNSRFLNHIHAVQQENEKLRKLVQTVLDTNSIDKLREFVELGQPQPQPQRPAAASGLGGPAGEEPGPEPRPGVGHIGLSLMTRRASESSSVALSEGEFTPRKRKRRFESGEDVASSRSSSNHSPRTSPTPGSKPVTPVTETPPMAVEGAVPMPFGGQRQTHQARQVHSAASSPLSRSVPMASSATLINALTDSFNDPFSSILGPSRFDSRGVGSGVAGGQASRAPPTSHGAVGLSASHAHAHSRPHGSASRRPQSQDFSLSANDLPHSFDPETDALGYLNLGFDDLEVIGGADDFLVGDDL
ncbi:uncharacterized protein AMSG_08555 [Thecamonas trahens ATCC 50062]|uniref:BHLH domain-containing protein n=1 Tax=Thecamonas trahens ATCC 50062 TaxID=461836 RepID=A0A0L0DKX9_THETB|nr:hypothetical protein AMSG_08555 [Thecamonas trahens ATCC 50062]KNC52681.1 hypothetical protein AMSG_08555 [Thecamonas trahens ATCC 50062]|eukprot:XP_013755228.1 hypothetical protein AMSG_08555 [Thecamonas trahens ATCC 50062]